MLFLIQNTSVILTLTSSFGSLHVVSKRYSRYFDAQDEQFQANENNYQHGSIKTSVHKIYCNIQKKNT